MSTTDLYADLIRRAEACEALCADDASRDGEVILLAGKAAAYRHAAELLRGAVAAAVEEEREAVARVADDAVAAARARRSAFCEDDRGYDIADGALDVAEEIADAIRARGESPRGDAASGGREGAE